MHSDISQREFRNDSGAVLRALVLGNSFTITRNGVPVGDLFPHRPTGGFTSRAAIMAAFGQLPSIDAEQFRTEVDGPIDQDPTPRG